MFSAGANNPVIEKLWSKIPEKEGKIQKVSVPINVMDLLPEDRTYYRFNGSLTTPPCTEGVRWLVMKMPVPVSEKQVGVFSHAIHHPNNRPMQPLNARMVLK